MTTATILSFLLLLEQSNWGSPLMDAVVKGLMVVGVGTIGWAVINKAKEGDIWSAVSTGVLGALALAFIGSEPFRDSLMGIVESLVEQTWPGTGTEE
jgi:hypothetical protein